MKHLLNLVLALGFSMVIHAQNDSIRTYKTDTSIKQDPRLNTLVMKHIMINEIKKGKTAGYRVQIHFGAEKAKALEVKTKYSELKKDVPSYLDYQQPYFKIRVGNFRTRLDAYRFLQEISGEFPGAFIVADEIELPQL